jgi:hypothetical protein
MRNHINNQQHGTQLTEAVGRNWQATKRGLFSVCSIGLAAFVVGLYGCGRLGLNAPSATKSAVSSASTTSSSTSSTGTAEDSLKVGVNFRIDPSLNPSAPVGASLALAAAGSVVLDGINHAVVNVLGCTSPSYNRESELHHDPIAPFAIGNFTVDIQSSSNAACYISLDILQITFDLDTGTTKTETYLRDVDPPAGQQSAADRDGGGELVFINRTSSGQVGPDKLYVSVTPTSWPDSTAATGGVSKIDYVLKSFSVISNDRDLSTIAVDQAVTSGSNSLIIGADVSMPVNLLTLGSTSNATPGTISRGSATADGSYAFELWCAQSLGGSSECGDMTAANTVFCAIPDVTVAVFDANNLMVQCPATGTGSATSALQDAIVAFSASRISDNSGAASGLLNNVIAARLDNFWDTTISKIPVASSAQGFWFVIRTDKADGTGFKYWHVTNVPADL